MEDPPRSGFWRRAVGTASPATLGGLRILICGILLLNVLWEDLASTALMPRGLVQEMGVMTLIRDGVPGFDAFLASAPALMAFKVWMAVILALGVLGYRTRIVLPVAVLSYLVFAGVLRMYAWFYHTGLGPLYLLVVLCFLPCADGLSLDCRRRRRRGESVPPLHEPHPRYAWGRYAVWVMMVIPYLAAGISKLRTSGFAWASAINMRTIVVRDSVNPMEFDFGLGEALADAPDAVFTFLAVMGIGSELVYCLVLFSPLARRVMPLLAVGLHVGILFLQNILFFDLILLQLMFFEGGAFAGVLGRLAALRRPAALSRAASWSLARIATAGAPDTRLWPPPSGAAAAMLLVLGVSTWSWVGAIEFYPLTAWQMYAGRTTRPEISYYAVVGRTVSGEMVRVDFDDGIGALGDSRYRGQLWRPFRRTSLKSYLEFVEICAREINQRAKPGEELMDIEVQSWFWRFASEDAEEQRLITARHVYRVPPPNPSVDYALPTSPEDLAYEYEAGIATQKLGDWAGALSYLDRVCQVDPERELALFRHAFSLQKLGRNEEAVASYRRSLSHHDFYQTHFNLGLALKDLGRFDAAIGHLQRTLELKPDYGEVHHHLGRIYESLNRPQEAAEHAALYQASRP